MTLRNLVLSFSLRMAHFSVYREEHRFMKLSDLTAWPVTRAAIE